MLPEDDDLRAVIDDTLVRQRRERTLSPDHPLLRGTAQNPDVFFQAREAIDPFYRACPTIVQNVMDRFAQRTGRTYRLFDYVGVPDAERVIVNDGLGSRGGRGDRRTVVAAGRKGWASEDTAFPPFAIEAFLSALPKTVRNRRTLWHRWRELLRSCR